MLVRLPATMRRKGQPGTIEVELTASGSLRGLLDQLEQQVPGATARLLTADGRLHGYVNLYVNGNDIRHGAGLDTEVQDGDELLILPAISGG
ncbi:MAG TPA: ubiquitin-like small modifier protein 1 [Candidatus Limnocylindrales bacterium]|nr:ubiquitin-like small modifier protein 1 [Candidatus Limnocylindrales bacterium]